MRMKEARGAYARIWEGIRHFAFAMRSNAGAYRAILENDARTGRTEGGEAYGKRAA